MKRFLLLEDVSSVDMVNGRDEVEKMEDKRETQEAE